MPRIYNEVIIVGSSLFYLRKQNMMHLHYISYYLGFFFFSKYKHILHSYCNFVFHFEKRFLKYLILKCVLKK